MNRMHFSQQLKTPIQASLKQNEECFYNNILDKKNNLKNAK